ncbi:MAG: DUF5618 family protein [Bacteroidales bacterium]|jgi:hypothetical protein|nr:DUF5618 family protein [Bacteroidales bacterium]
MAELKNRIKEAERYLDNARKVLTENAGKQGEYYTDPKYVKAAGNYAWNGVLVALDAVTDVQKTRKKGQRLDIKDYQNAVAKKDKKMNIPFLTAYESLHKTLGYDGNLRYTIVQDALKQGKTIVDWASKYYEE